MVNVKQVQLGKNVRQSFSHIEEVLDMPNLIEVQKNSYKWFLTDGLKEVFRDISSITDYQGNLVLEFLDYRLDEKPKYTIEECKERDTTYAAPMRVRVRLLNNETGEIKESDVFMGDFPLMTDSGTFIINGAERVIVSQLVRSPGVYYASTRDKAGKELFSSTVIPNRGAWLEYETDSNDIFYVRIDKNRKLPITTFIRAMGLSTDQEIENLFGDEPLLRATFEKDTTINTEEALLEVYRKLRPGEPPTGESAQSHLDGLFFVPRRDDLSGVGRYKYNKTLAIAPRLTGQTVTRPVVDPRTGEVLAEAGELLTREKAQAIGRVGVDVVYVQVGESEVKVMSNGMVDIKDYVDFDAEELGVNEKVRFSVLCDILDNSADEEAVKEAIKARIDELIPKHIILDDIYASINYMCG
ncbi:MAG: DNA-directed RNA polymerase subunit beta, partial [Oscillospiraceae bacterium]|nr:DNA-directed RNA polymerase subunit beta [Oscillospiraceae bacterium]